VADGIGALGIVVGNPVIDEIRRDRTFVRHACGGTATYATLALRALGAEAALLGAVGGDWPETLHLPLDDAGVDLRHLRIERAAASTAYRLDYDGEPPVRTVRRRCQGPVVGPGEVPEVPSGAAFVHVGPVAGEVGPGAVEALASWGLPLAIDLHALRAFSDEGAVRLGSAAESGIDFSRFDTIKGAVEEVLAFTPGTRDVVEGLQAIAARGVRCVFATDGRNGALMLVGGEIRKVPAYPVGEVDATGAGDVFLAGFLYARHVRGESAYPAALFGAATASFVVQGPGTSVLGDLDGVLARRATLWDT
jgi:sugar/nucleoside kinase (ribokinase family)